MTELLISCSVALVLAGILSLVLLENKPVREPTPVAIYARMAIKVLIGIFLGVPSLVVIIFLFKSLFKLVV